MNSVSVAAIVFGFAMSGAVVGMVLQRLLPEKHMQSETKEIVRLGTGLIATMAALVLGLLVSTAKSSFDAENSAFRELALNAVLLDRALAQFGADGEPARAQLQRTLAQMIESIWPTDSTQAAGRVEDAKITAEGSSLLNALHELQARDEMQQSLKSTALQLATELGRDRWRLSQTNADSLPTPFLVVLAFWLAVLFGSFGLFSPRNPLAYAALLVCAASVAGAIFLIVDLDQPFDGLVKASSMSMRDAQAKLGR